MRYCVQPATAKDVAMLALSMEDEDAGDTEYDRNGDQKPLDHLLNAFLSSTEVWAAHNRDGQPCALWGVGPVTAAKLRARGIDRLVDVRTADAQLLRETVGSLADWLTQLANGIDERPVTPNREAKSSGSENTYPTDLTDIDTIRLEIAEMASHAIGWLVRKQLLARTVTIKVRYDDFTTITRSHSALATRDQQDLTARAVRLLEKTEAGSRPVRLLGVSVHNFCGDDDVDPERLPFE